MTAYGSTSMRGKMTKKTFIHLTCSVFSVLTASCAFSHPTSTNSQGNVLIQAQAIGSTARLQVDVSGPGISPALGFSIPVALGKPVIDTLSVPAGSSRRIVVTAIDTLGSKTHRADSLINILPGQQTAISLVLRPLTTRVGITITFGSSAVTSFTGAGNKQMGGQASGW